MKYAAAIAMLAALAIGCSSSSPGASTTAASVEPASEPAEAEAPVTITGSGIENSAPFHLNGGIYLVEWTATPHSGSDGCYHGAQLEAVDPDAPITEMLASEDLDSAAPLTGTTYVYDLAGGDYYIQAASGCDWSFTFTAQ